MVRPLLIDSRPVLIKNVLMKRVLIERLLLIMRVLLKSGSLKSVVFPRGYLLGCRQEGRGRSRHRRDEEGRRQKVCGQVRRKERRRSCNCRKGSFEIQRLKGHDGWG
jgi:hypothetical protein